MSTSGERVFAVIVARIALLALLVRRQPRLEHVRRAGIVATGCRAAGLREQRAHVLGPDDVLADLRDGRLAPPAEPDLVLEPQPGAPELVAHVRRDIGVRLGSHQGADNCTEVVVAPGAVTGTSASSALRWLAVCFAASMSTSAAPEIVGSLSNQLAIA